MIGMLWFDDSKKTTAQEKILRAIDYYKVKYSRSAHVCLCSPKMTEKVEIPGVEIKVDQWVGPNHFYISEGVKS